MPAVDPKNENFGKIGQVQKLHHRVAREAASLRSNLERLEAMETFLRTEVLLHQASQLLDHGEPEVISSNSTKLLLKAEQMELLQKQLRINRRVSPIELSQVEEKVDQVQGMDVNIDSDLNTLVDEGVPKGERGLLKRLHFEGNIDEIAYELRCVSNHTMENQIGEVKEVGTFDIGQLPPALAEMSALLFALDNTHIDKTLSNIYYFQMLDKERTECLLTLKEEIPNLSISEDTDPVELEYHPTRDQIITIKWGIVFDPTNYRLKYDIELHCLDDVLAYYSKNETVFLYLSGRRDLQHSEDLINFFNAFG
ncbi:hypothetical protein SK128_024068 [Halocaridina rubra]|uniref:Uncharacterized protein n=1 Tax=Halocaridina rubra TaxID=373956 RepID=A0AAN9ABI7_HALRR